MNIFIHTRDASLLRLMRRRYGRVNEVELSQLVGDSAIDFDTGDLVMVDRIPEQGFYECKASVIVVEARADSADELQAARTGAVGFITMSASERLIAKAISCVANGEVWMSRETIATVFSEYAGMLKKERV